VNRVFLEVFCQPLPLPSLGGVVLLVAAAISGVAHALVRGLGSAAALHSLGHDRGGVDCVAT
jgi:hypothetical protein